eukprot:g2977.t1
MVMAPQAFASAFSDTLRFVVDIPDRFCRNMKRGKEHVDMIEKITNFFWKPDKSPQEYGECRAMREINEHLPRVRKEAQDVAMAACPFEDNSGASGAREEWTEEMRDLCRFMGQEGSGITENIHDELTRGICSDDGAGHGINKVIADITFGLCWRVVDNLSNDREFGCPFFEEAQHYIKSSLDILDKIAKENEKGYRDLYCEYVLWSFEGARTVSFGSRPENMHHGPRNGEFVVRVSPRAFDLGFRVKDLVVAIVEENDTVPATSLGRIIFGSDGKKEVQKHKIHHHGDVAKYVNEQKRISMSGSDHWSRQVARDLWRSWQVRLVVKSYDGDGASEEYETDPVPLGMLDSGGVFSGGVTRFD